MGWGVNIVMPGSEGWDFCDFKRDVSWISTLGRAGPVQLGVDCRRQLVCLPLRQTVEVKVWPWSPVDLSRQISWGLRDVLCVCWVSIVKIVSPLVSKNLSQKLINVSYLNNGELSVFRIFLHQYILHRQCS